RRDLARLLGDARDVTLLQMRHAAAARIDDFAGDAVLRQHGARRLADPRVVVVDEAGGVEHRLAAMGGRGGIDLGRIALGAHREALAVEFRQLGAPVDMRELLHRRPRQTVLRVARPVGERRHRAGELAVAVGLDELPLRPGQLALAEIGGAIAQHQMRKIDIPLMRRDIGAFGHEAHVAERAGFDHLAVIGGSDAVDLARLRIVDEIEEPRKAVAEIEAAPAGVADVEDAMHLRVDLGAVVEIRILPVDPVSRGRLEAAFPHRSSPLLRKREGAQCCAPPRTSCRLGGDQPSVSSAFWKRPAWDFSALASVSNQSATSSKPSWRAVRAMPGYMSVYSCVSPAIAALRLSPVAPIGLPVAGSPTSSRNSRCPCAWPVSPSAVERNTAATSL